MRKHTDGQIISKSVEIADVLRLMVLVTSDKCRKSHSRLCASTPLSKTLKNEKRKVFEMVDEIFSNERDEKFYFDCEFSLETVGDALWIMSVVSRYASTAGLVKWGK